MTGLVFPVYLRGLAAGVLGRAGDYWIATAESCTGGLLAACLTDIPGSSQVVAMGHVTYSNAAKTQMLGVDPQLIAAHGAVSREVAEAMAAGALLLLPIEEPKRGRLSAAITGIAGPGGGSPEKPVGLVHLAVAASTDKHRRRLLQEEHRFGDPGRGKIRELSVGAALALMDRMLSSLG